MNTKPDPMDAHHERNSRVPQMLFALLSVTPGPMRTINATDWSEYGLSSDDFETWWEISQAAMREHQQRVAAQARAKLTFEELHALGVRP